LASLAEKHGIARVSAVPSRIDRQAQNNASQLGTLGPEALAHQPDRQFQLMGWMAFSRHVGAKMMVGRSPGQELFGVGQSAEHQRIARYLNTGNLK
jgi:hypothetical protein